MVSHASSEITSRIERAFSRAAQSERSRDTATSPSSARCVCTRSPSESVTGFAGTKAAFGKPMREVLSISREQTSVIVSLDHDFLQFEAGELPAQRGFAASRSVEKPGDAMSRLYVIESAFSITGGQADHRLRLSPSRVTAFACALGKKVLGATTFNMSEQIALRPRQSTALDCATCSH